VETCDRQQLTKKLRSLRKKLKGIEELETKFQSGLKLDPDEMNKMSKKDEVTTSIEEIVKAINDS
jgi:hypothetical protein